MAEQVYWEDVTEGMDLPSLVKEPTTRQLVQYAGALRGLLRDSLR